MTLPFGFVQIDGGVRLYTTDTHHVDVLMMIYTDRIVTTPIGQDPKWASYDRYWCYKKGGAATIAALVWDGSNKTEPVGWIKAHGERRPGDPK